jgi:hypothetical protein
MASESIGALYPTQIPGYADNADIQAAFRLYHYGSTAYSTANSNTANLVNPSAQSTSDSLHLAEVNQVPLVDLVKMQKVTNKVVEAEGDIDLGLSKIDQAVSVVAEMLGTSPSFDWWEAIRIAYQSSYKVSKPKVDEAGLESAWGRITTKLSVNFELKKPASPRKGSVAVSESRQKKLDGVKRLTDDQIQKAIAGFKEVENFDEAKFYKQEMKRREELKNAPLIEKRKENQNYGGITRII